MSSTACSRWVIVHGERMVLWSIRAVIHASISSTDFWTLKNHQQQILLLYCKFLFNFKMCNIVVWATWCGTCHNNVYLTKAYWLCWGKIIRMVYGHGNVFNYHMGCCVQVEWEVYSKDFTLVFVVLPFAWVWKKSRFRLCENTTTTHSAY